MKKVSCSCVCRGRLLTWRDCYKRRWMAQRRPKKIGRLATRGQTFWEPPTCCLCGSHGKYKTDLLLVHGRRLSGLQFAGFKKMLCPCHVTAPSEPFLTSEKAECPCWFGGQWVIWRLSLTIFTGEIFPEMMRRFQPAEQLHYFTTNRQRERERERNIFQFIWASSHWWPPDKPRKLSRQLHEIGRYTADHLLLLTEWYCRQFSHRIRHLGADVAAFNMFIRTAARQSPSSH